MAVIYGSEIDGKWIVGDETDSSSFFRTLTRRSAVFFIFVPDYAPHFLENFNLEQINSFFCIILSILLKIITTNLITFMTFIGWVCTF